MAISKLNWKSERRTEKAGGCLSSSHLIDLLLTVIVAVSLTVAVAGFAVSTGAATVTQFLLLIPCLILVLVVQYSLKIHHCPGMPGLRTNGIKQKISSMFAHDVIFQLTEGQMSTGRLFSDPNIQACLSVFSKQL